MCHNVELVCGGADARGELGRETTKAFVNLQL